MTKVFCKTCKHIKYYECAMGCYSAGCKSNPIPRHDAIHAWTQNEDCEVKNRNNDCTEFSVKRRWL